MASRSPLGIALPQDARLAECLEVIEIAKGLLPRLAVSCEDPDNSENVILLYTGRSHPKADKVSTVLNPDYDNDSWNREHVWPKSHGFPSQGQLAHTDIHHLRPTDVTCNSDRGNLDFDESEFAHTDCACWRDADSFEPRDAVKGDIARMAFYMDVRYAGDDGVPDLALIDEDSNSGPLLGHLCTLLAWNSADSVDEVSAGAISASSRRKATATRLSTARHSAPPFG